VATVRNALVRVTRAWRALAPDQRLAALAAVALLVTMLLPWYEKSFYDTRLRSPVTDSISAFGVLSWIEAAIFVLSVGVMALLFFRAEERAFHLPGGDGTVIFGAGAWAAFLLLWRVFDRPDVSGSGATVGIQWGFFFAFLASGALAFAGWRMRVAHRAEPTAAQDPTTKVEPTPPPMTAVTRSGTGTVRRRRRVAGPDAPTQIAGQLSFEENDEPPPDRPAAPGEIPPVPRRDRP
jgi:hypothetical protein